MDARFGLAVAEMRPGRCCVRIRVTPNDTRPPCPSLCTVDLVLASHFLRNTFLHHPRNQLADVPAYTQEAKFPTVDITATSISLVTFVVTRSISLPLSPQPQPTSDSISCSPTLFLDTTQQANPNQLLPSGRPSRLSEVISPCHSLLIITTQVALGRPGDEASEAKPLNGMEQRATGSLVYIEGGNTSGGEVKTNTIV